MENEEIVLSEGDCDGNGVVSRLIAAYLLAEHCDILDEYEVSGNITSEDGTFNFRVTRVEG